MEIQLVLPVLLLSVLAFTVTADVKEAPALAPSWPKGIIPYQFDSFNDNKTNAQFLEGVKSIENVSCVKFIPRTTEKDYLLFTNGRYVTSARVGRIGGEQEMSLYVRAPKWQILALLMQTLGFYNEFRRTDRDNFISIKRGLISETDMKIVPGYNAATAGSPFDVKSILHSVPFFSSEKEALAGVITVKNSKDAFGSWDSLSKNDVLKINNRYQCKTPH